MILDQLVARVFQARTVAHREHLKTKSYAAHMALGSFYDDIIDAIDAIVEAHQGRYGLLVIPTVEDKPVASIATYLMNEALWIEKNRDKFSDCQAILNLVDTLTAVYLGTLYKLNHLS